MKSPAPDTLEMLQTLRNAVSKTLEHKRRLGQYAVLWKNGKVVFTEGDRDSAKSSNTTPVHELNEESTRYNTQPRKNEPDGRTDDG